jgi:arylsulfatase A-like enzyme
VEVENLPPSATTLAEVLQMYDYQTAAFTGGFHISSIYGIDQGFDTYFDEMEYGRLKDVLPRARHWLSRRGDKKFFLFLHAYDTHAPYELPKKYQHLYEQDYDGILNKFEIDHTLGDNIKGYTLRVENGKTYQLSQRDIEHWIAQYDSAITYMDKQIGDFLNYLERLKLMDNTIVIFLGDHGEALLDHSYILRSRHGDIYEEGIHVPLIIKLPRQLYAKSRKSVIDTQVQLIDLMPTILEWLNIPTPHQVQGRSLVALINGTAPPDFNKFVFSIGASGGWMPWRSCIRSQEWKLLQFRDGASSEARYELYHLPTDPREQNNLIDTQPEIARTLKERLKQWENKVVSAKRYEALLDRALGRQMKRRMRERGYWWLDMDRPLPKSDQNNKLSPEKPKMTTEGVPLR